MITYASRDAVLTIPDTRESQTGWRPRKPQSRNRQRQHKKKQACLEETQLRLLRLLRLQTLEHEMPPRL